MALLVSLLAGLLPMLFYAWLLYHLDRYEKEPFALLAGVFFWGALFAAGSAFLINSTVNVGLNILLQSESASFFTLATLVAPPVEETVKGMAVLGIYLLFRSEFDSRLDGILYAAVTALGFAAAENAYYLHHFGFQSAGWSGFLKVFAVRVLLVGWQHPFYTAFFGLGLAAARSSRSWTLRWIAPLMGWWAAVILHMVHNLFSGLIESAAGVLLASLWDWIGYLGLFIYILLLIDREQDWIQEYLPEEVELGTFTKSQYTSMSSLSRQIASLWKARRHGAWRETRRFFQLAGELSHKKRQLIREIAMPESDQIIQNLRAQLQCLSKTLPS